MADKEQIARFGRNLALFLQKKESGELNGNTSLVEAKMRETASMLKLDYDTEVKTIRESSDHENNSESLMLHGVDYMEYDPEEDRENPAVKPEEIYQTITDLMINTIKKVGHLPWQKEWKTTGLGFGRAARNYISKKPYRGINYFLLNFKQVLIDGELVSVPRDLINPYFLTFKQVDKLGGKVKKGARGEFVIYYTALYKYDRDGLDFATYDRAKFIAWVKEHRSQIRKMQGKSPEYVADHCIVPILKYYKVFNGEFIEGVNWEDVPENFSSELDESQRLAVGEAIYESYPGHPEVEHRDKNRAFYSPLTDHINMPPFANFSEPQFYYTTLFHEAVHSTGHENKLGRVFGRKGSKEYAFEELIAEMGAVYLCGESGIMFKTLHNSAKYLAHWNENLVEEMQEDNRFFFRAASAAQKAADYILDRDKAGVPAYMQQMNAILEMANQLELRFNPSLPVIEVDPDLVGGETLTQLQKNVREYAKKHFASTTVENEDQKVAIEIRPAGIKRVINKKAPLYKTLAVPYIPQFIKKGLLTEIESDRKGRVDVYRYLKFQSIARIEGQEYSVKVIVRETKEGKLFYDQTVVEKEKPVGISGRASQKEKLPSQPSTGRLKDTEFVEKRENPVKVPFVVTLKRLNELHKIRSIKKLNAYVGHKHPCYLVQSGNTVRSHLSFRYSPDYREKMYTLDLLLDGQIVYTACKKGAEESFSTAWAEVVEKYGHEEIEIRDQEHAKLVLGSREYKKQERAQSISEKPVDNEKKKVPDVKEEPQKPVDEKPGYPFSVEDIPYQVAYDAHRGTSFSPDKRAKSAREGYFAELKDIYDRFYEKAKKQDRVDEFHDNFGRFLKGYKKRYLDHLYSRSGFMSTMITGGSNFPVARMQKKSDSIHKKLGELIKYVEKAEGWILKDPNTDIKTGQEGSLEKLEKKLQGLIEQRDMNTRYNKIARKYKKSKASPEEKEEGFRREMSEAGFKEKLIENSLAHGFYLVPSYINHNLNGNIKRVKEQIIVEKRLAEKREGGNKELPFPGGHVLQNYEINKVQIFFDEKPEKEVRSFLKKAGHAFKWAPSQGAWQRQLNTYYPANYKDLLSFLGVERENPEGVVSAKTLKKKRTARFIFIGVCAKMLIDQGKANPTELRGTHAVLTNKTADKIFIVPFSELQEIYSHVKDKKAEEIYKMWHNFAPDQKDFVLRWPKDEPVKPVGTAHSIYYVSDKVLQEWDRKGKMNMYHHEFDPGKRPCTVKGKILIVSNLEINERGILN